MKEHHSHRVVVLQVQYSRDVITDLVMLYSVPVAAVWICSSHIYRLGLGGALTLTWVSH